MINTVCEGVLVEWGRRNGYVVLDRQEKEDILAEERMAEDLTGTRAPHKIQKEDEAKIPNKGIIEEYNSLADTARRRILTPTGYIEHSFGASNQTQDRPLNGSEDLNYETIDFVHGPYIPDWRSDKVTIKQRNENSLIRFVIFMADDEEIDPNETGYVWCPLNLRHFIRSTDPLYQLLFRSSRADEYIEDLAKGVPYELRRHKAEPRIDMHGIIGEHKVPRSEQTYWDIMNRIAVMINSTKH